MFLLFLYISTRNINKYKLTALILSLIHIYPDGYGKSQFYYHLKQNLVAKKDVTAVLANTYKPGEKLMVEDVYKRQIRN